MLHLFEISKKRAFRNGMGFGGGSGAIFCGIRG